jgi:hypothetical protein
MAKAVVRNDWRINSNADPDAYSYAQRNTNSDTHSKYNSESYTLPNAFAYTYAVIIANSKCHDNSYP